ncbi:uncharacterized protein PAF06_007951 [Gastrophryne carolinensis]
MEVLSKHRTLLMGLAGLGATLAVTWFFLSRRKKKQLRRVGEVSQLFLYPIKSCKGIPLQEAECKEYGLKSGQLKDRHWLVVKEDKVLVTARQEPRMVLITLTCDDRHMTLSAPGMENLDVPLKLPNSNAIFTCKVFGNQVSGRDCGDAASRWVTSFLRSAQTYRLVQFEDKMKHRNPKNEFPLYTENDKVAYPDLSPYLLFSEASLEDLNSRLEKKVTVRNFRPNIMVSGCKAYAEDSWKEIQIGSQLTFRRVMPCGRCILTTVDPDTGIIDMKQPLETLRSYRKTCEQLKSSPLFGQYVKILKAGNIKIGDPVGGLSPIFYDLYGEQAGVCAAYSAMEVLSKHRTLLMGLAGLGATLAVTWFFLSRRKKKKLRRVGEVSQLFLYPVKSCRGISLQEAECKAYGLQSGQVNDRHWLVVKEDKVLVSARQEPRMVLITVTCYKGHITLSAPGMQNLDVPLKLPKTNAIFSCKVHGHQVQGRDCGEEASRWITNFLNSVQTYQLVQFENHMKHRQPKTEAPLYTENDQVAYPDLGPYLMLSEASLEDLNSRLEKKVTVRNFRPNIVVSGCEAFAEDSWKEIQIGRRVTFRRVMACGRCILTTVDPDTGIINMKEPVQTLRSFRKTCEFFKGSPLFGQFVNVLKTGKIKIGDPVYEITY